MHYKIEDRAKYNQQTRTEIFIEEEPIEIDNTIVESAAKKN